MLIKPHKIVIDLNPDGTFKDGIIMYQIQDNNGVVGKTYKSLSFSSTVTVAQMNGILDKAIKLVEQTEGI